MDKIKRCLQCGREVSQILWTTKNKKVKQVMCGAYVNGVKNGNVQYKCLYNGKRISYKKWDQIVTQWTRQKRELNFYGNTAFNRENNMKM